MELARVLTSRNFSMSFSFHKQEIKAPAKAAKKIQA